MTSTKTKKKRGRPKKKPKELPKFKNSNEIRKYLTQQSLLLTLELVEIATKKNNIKNPSIARAKNNQYKTALEGLKTTASLLKDEQITEIEEKIKLMEEGILASATINNNEIEPSENVQKALENIAEITSELKAIQTGE